MNTKTSEDMDRDDFDPEAADAVVKTLTGEGRLVGWALPLTARRFKDDSPDFVVADANGWFVAEISGRNAERLVEAASIGLAAAAPDMRDVLEGICYAFGGSFWTETDGKFVDAVVAAFYGYRPGHDWRGSADFVANFKAGSGAEVKP